MSILLGLLFATQPVATSSVQSLPYSVNGDCRTVFIPMNFNPQRPADKRPPAKTQPLQRPQPTQRPCLTKASA